MPLTPVDLQCDHRVLPLGIDRLRPALGWRFKGTEIRGKQQSAYQIIVSSRRGLAAQGKGDLWDSGKVANNQNIDRIYRGKPLQSSTEFWWRVRLWDEKGRVGPWSTTSTWTTGILHPEEWKAKWIGIDGSHRPGSIVLSRNLIVKKGLKRALMHVTGLGHYELTVNGNRPSIQWLAPGWTNYRKTVLYETIDLSGDLHEGENKIEILLGNGMDHIPAERYRKFTDSIGPQRAFAQLSLDFGPTKPRETVVTDESWKVRPGPITFSSVFGGEDYDDRLNDNLSPLQPAVEVRAPGGMLKGVSESAPPIVLHTIPGQHRKSVTIRAGVEVVDLGQNANVMPLISATGVPGSRIRIIPAELIHADGTVDRSSVGGGDSWWQVTIGASGKINYEAKFFYHGCRYLQVERSAPAGSDLPKITYFATFAPFSQATPVGEFSCSNPLFNRIHNLISWAQKSNMMSVLTDCPHRERLGWLEQYHLNGPSLRYEHDLQSLFSKTLGDMADSQRPDGLVPDIAPEYVVFQGGFVDSPEWGSSIILVPWQQYLWHGDMTLLRDRYEAMKRYQAYLRSRSVNHILSHGLGDWYDVGPKPPGSAQLTPVALTATAFYFEDTKILAKTARLLGHLDDAVAFEVEAASIKSAFNKRFFDANRGDYASGSQTANAIPLVMGLTDGPYSKSSLDLIVADVAEHHNGVTAGDVGYRYLLRALADGNRSDVIYAMNNQSERPGYGYQLKMGATSLTEAWDARRDSSQNHFMLGQIMEWFYHDLAGIQPLEEQPGFKQFAIKPAFLSELTHVRGRFVSGYGEIVSEWRREKGVLSLAVKVPPNTSALVYLPSQNPMLESGKPISIAKHISRVRTEGKSVVYRVESGVYRFSTRT